MTGALHLGTRVMLWQQAISYVCYILQGFHRLFKMSNASVAVVWLATQLIGCT